MSVTLLDILDDFNADVMPTTEEITAWNPLGPVQIVQARLMAGRLGTTAEDTVTTKVGLFGADLTAFNEACTAAADTEICDPADYVDYNGWGVGVCWSDSEDTTTNTYNGVIFTDSLWAVNVVWDDSENTVIEGVADSVAVDAPTFDDYEGTPA
jgi:hypothetical protein